MAARRPSKPLGRARSRVSPPSTGGKPASPTASKRSTPLRSSSRKATGAAEPSAQSGVARSARAQEVAAAELIPMLGGGTIDADEHQYRSTGEGIRDLPRYTHERQIELAWGMYLCDPLAKFIIDFTANYVVGPGLNFKIDESEAEREAKQQEKAEAAKARAEEKRKAAQEHGLPAPPIPGQWPRAAERAAEVAGNQDSEGGEEVGSAAKSAPPSKKATKGASRDDLDAEGSDADGSEPTVAELKAVLDAHWNDPDNRWPLKMRERATGLGIWGEQFYPVFVRPSDGHVKVGRLDPRSIKEVRTDPENAECVTHVIVNAVPGQPERVYRVVSLCEDPDDEANGFLVGERLGEAARDIHGICFYFAINRVQGAKRGHSDIFHLIDWIDAYGGLLFDSLDAAKAQRAHLYDVTLKGATEGQIKSWMSKHGTPPRPGSVRVHNESEAWDALTPDLKGSDHAEFARLYRNHILGGAHIPEHNYGGGGDVNRSTADSMDVSKTAAADARRALFISFVEDILRFAVDQAILAGRIHGTPLTKNRVHVVAPELEVANVADGATALASGVSAITVAEDRGYITRDTARSATVSLLDHIGVKVDAENEKAAVEAEEEASAVDDLARAQAEAENARAVAEAAAQAEGRGVVPVQGGAAPRAAEGVASPSALTPPVEVSDHVGIFLPVPPEIAAQFPPKPEDLSPPHATILYVGSVTREEFARLRWVVAKVAQATAPFAVEMTDYGEFTNDDGATIAHMTPRVDPPAALGDLHDRLWGAVEGAGIAVGHHDGFLKPHVTLAYVPAGAAHGYDGLRPMGRWVANRVELWGFGERIRLPMCTPSVHGLRASEAERATGGASPAISMSIANASFAMPEGTKASIDARLPNDFPVHLHVAEQRVQLAAGAVQVANTNNVANNFAPTFAPTVVPSAVAPVFNVPSAPAPIIDLRAPVNVSSPAVNFTAPPIVLPPARKAVRKTVEIVSDIDGNAKSITITPAPEEPTKS